MAHTSLVAALTAASVIVALESAWLLNRIRPVKYLAWVTRKPASTVFEALYYLGFPYLALVSGLLPARLLGLKGLQSPALPDFTQPAPQVINALLLQAGDVLHIWLPDIGPWVSTGSLLGGLFVAVVWLYVRGGGPRQDTSPFPIYESWAGVAFDVVHWGFYRAAVWLVSGSLYLGVVGGVAVMLFEQTVAGRLGRGTVPDTQRQLLRFGLGVVTSVTFLFAPNLWLVFVLQAILAGLSRGVAALQHPSSLPAGQNATLTPPG
ncbi:MAG: hypothetical protein ACE5G8_05310 [Anaerolineae bacterium]